MDEITVRLQKAAQWHRGMSESAEAYASEEHSGDADLLEEAQQEILILRSVLTRIRLFTDDMLNEDAPAAISEFNVMQVNNMARSGLREAS